MRRRAFLTGAPIAALTACSAPRVWAPQAAVARATVPGTSPASLTLYTMKNTGSGNGAHTSLLINASQRVMWDPAGNFQASAIPERNDVLFGMTRQIEALYVSYHARESYFVLSQYLPVTPEIAEAALELALVSGPVPKANCTRVTSAMLRQIPGFEGLPRTWIPNKLADAFGQLPGVQEQIYREDDDDDKTIAARRIEAMLGGATP